MKFALRRASAVVALIALLSAAAFGQAVTTGAIAGTVTDQAGAIVANANVSVKNDATGNVTETQTADNGTFNVASLPTGSYTVTISAPNFKQTIVKDVKVNVGSPSSINVALEVGAVSEQVTITGAGGELLQTQTATVGQTITGRQITDLPFTSRDALDLVLLLPGTATPGTPRTSTVNGLPKGSLNITLDGVNVQDNNLKSSFGGGFFTYVRPRIDAIDEVTVSTATPGAESSGEGAVQLKFVTRSGTNEFHGSAYEYHRETSFNANYWFNNRNNLQRDPIHLNQYGGRVGGPIFIPGVFNTKRDKAFFFTNLEEFRLPEAISRTRTILNPSAEQGLYTLASGAQLNILNIVAARSNCGTTAAPVPCTSTVDPTISALLAKIRASTAQGSLSRRDDNRQFFNFTNLGGQLRRFAAVRFDYNVTSKHHLENIWNYQRFGGADVDFLNGVDPPFPGFNAGVGGQHSLRFTNATALRSTITSNIVNEARFGIQGGNSFFRDTVSPASFADQRGFAINFPFALTSPFAARSNQRRNSPVKTFTDTVTWVKGTHTLNMGGTFSQYNNWTNALNNIVPSLTLGVDTTDPVNGVFTSANFPGASGTDLTNIRNIYALLVGRVTAVNANAYLNESGDKLAYLGESVRRFRLREYGGFAQDSWRFRPNLTLNYGLRYEIQEPIVSENRAVTQTTEAGLFGVSGFGRLFQPGVQSGASPTLFNVLEPGVKAYRSDHSKFLPSVGFAYSPDWKSGIMHRFFGDQGQTVLRAGYSISTTREGLSIGASILGSNPGGVTAATRSIAIGNLTPGSNFRDAATTTPPTLAAPTFPQQGSISASANAFESNLRTGYVQSWSGGIQRELTKDMVVEVRYVGNRGVKLWRQLNLNEINTVENNFFNEFRAMQRNLAANVAANRCQAGVTTAGCQFNFAYFGEGTGTSPLPITLGYLRGCVPNAAGACTSTYDPNLASQYTSANFRNAALYSLLSPNRADPQGFASLLFNSAGLRANAASINLARNLFIVNPDYLGGAFLVTNTGRSYYDGLTIELRRRLSQGLLLQGSYTLSKAQTNMYASNDDLFDQPPTLRNDRLGRTVSPFDIRHGFKMNWIYELPFGRGKMWGGDVGKLANWAIGGWEWHGTARLQSGTPFNFGNVQLVGMTKKDLQKAIEVRKNPSRVDFLPQDIIDNTIRAFNVDVTSSTGYSTLGVPTGRYIAPASSGGCVQAFSGQCGFSRLVLYGPRFFRFDTSVVKKIRFTENTNIELRAEFLNAINNQNFKIGAPGSEVVNFAYTDLQSTDFGQTTNAYRDISTTNDPGGRIIQFVLRFNF
ncbi:MAG TPA: TonB-dependent receptor [Pyrinomonadaceae bacterium]|jgi:hypothetical protein